VTYLDAIGMRVVSFSNSAWTQNGHIRNDTRDVSRRILRGPNPVSLQEKLCRDGADGAFVEPSGRNHWQSVANAMAAKTAQTSRNRCHRLRPVADRSAW
jgi:hypothetical protein